MNSKNYLKIIGAKLEFLGKYFRVFRLLIIIIYLVYLSSLIINVFSAIEYVPDPAEVKIKFSPIRAKDEVIDSIEDYFSAKQDNLEKNLSKTQERNPFSPYAKEELKNLNDVGEIKPSIVN